MNKLPSRSDEIYKEIESFEEYELTNNIAYEMMIRNDDFLSILSKYSKKEINENTIGNLYEELSNYCITYKYPLYVMQYSFIGNDEKKFIYKLNEFISDNDFNIRQWGEAFSTNKYKCTKKNKGFKYYSTTDVFQTRILKLKDANETIDGKPLKEDILYRMFISNGIDKDKYYTEHQVRKIDQLEISIPYGIYFDVTYKKTEKEAFLTNDYDENIIDSVIYQLPNRPRLKCKHTNKDTKIILNLSLPKNELLAYVSHIKDLEENQNIIKSPIELLGEDLQKADDISKMCTENKNGNKKCFDSRNGITKTRKLSDLFFIYDMDKIGIKQSKIRVMLDEYYDPNNEKTEGMSEDTFRKYLHIAKDYIEKKRYKEIITGTKP